MEVIPIFFKVIAVRSRSFDHRTGDNRTKMGPISPSGLGPVNGVQTFPIYLKLFASVACSVLELRVVARLAASATHLWGLHAPDLSSGDVNIRVLASSQLTCA